MGDLVHLPDQIVDLVFPVAQVTTFNEVLELPLTEAASRTVELERPEEVRGRLKVWSNCADLMDKILHADHAVFTQVLLDNLVVGQRESLLVDLAIATLCT